MEQKEEELRIFFEACDTNGNGTLQFAEFAALLQILEADMEQETCRIGFAEIDLDRNGQIDFREFFSWWVEH